MDKTPITSSDLKQTLKEALAETLNEERDLLRDVMTEALEDFALIEAIKEGEQTESVPRDSVFSIFEGRG